MASSQTIKDSMLQSIRTTNSTIDTTKGPVYDLLLRPVPDEIAGPSQDIEDIKNLYSVLIAENPDNTAAIDTLGRAFRVSKPVGRRARTSLVFWFTALPSQEIKIPAGTAVATSDRSVIYTTTSDIQGINAISAYNFYNTSTGRYEVYVDAVATQDGQAQEIPAFRLTLLLSKLTGISGVYNPVPGTGGITAGGYDTYIAKIQSRFRGQDSGSFTSYDIKAHELYPDVVIGFIPSSDRLGFRRYVRGDGFDCVVASPNTTVAEETFQVNSASSFVPTRQPVLEVLGVYLNGTLIQDYELVKNTSQDYKDSAKARDHVRITRSLKTSDTLRIRHTYCAYCYDLQSQVFLSNTDDFFGHDALVRLAQQCDLNIDVSIQTSSSNSDFQNSVTAYISSYINSLGFVPSVDPDDLISELMQAYTEIRGIRINTFQRLVNASSSIEIIELKAYEIPRLQAQNIQVKITG